MRLGYLAVLAGFSALLAAGAATPADAAGRVTASQASVTDFSAQAQRRARRPARVRVTRQLLPPDAVRECQAWYVQEHRPSGTVITPRMQCWWTR